MTPTGGGLHEQTKTHRGGSDSMTFARPTPEELLGVPRDQAPSKRAVIYIRVSTRAQAERDGNPEGYSLPTQRTACRLRAEQLGAVVVDEYVDKDTATRLDKRPAMLALIKRVKQERDVDFVIVHQLSRFARNRLDDARITEDLEANGAVLISCLEGIDQTTPGRMLQGILAVINEYQSRNQSEDIKRKTLQKVQDGGTPSLAPIGYVNKQGFDGDMNKRWVEVDPVRAPHIIWAFDAYASGNYSLSSLAKALAQRGLLQRPTANRAARPLEDNKLQAILRNRYYIGIVTYHGTEYAGKHPALVEASAFERVQQLLTSHRQSGERAYRHSHYLKGTLRCNRCQSRLGHGISRGNGGRYEYFFCLGRHKRRTVCDLPHLQADEVEDAVTAFYGTDQLEPGELEQLRQYALEDLAHAAKRTDSERKRLLAKISDVRQTRNLLADKVLASTIPDDVARERQTLLNRQLVKAETDLARLDRLTDTSRVDIEKLFDLAQHAEEAYRRSPDEMRRDWNLARYEYLDMDIDREAPFVANALRTPVFEGLRTARVPASRLDKDHHGEHEPVFCLSHGSNVELLVEVTGFEPATSTMRT